eukprot:14207916-Alexandrium_andersonii.AAC.1
MSWSTEPVLNGAQLLCSSWRTGDAAHAGLRSTLLRPTDARRVCAYAGGTPGVMRRPRPVCPQAGRIRGGT